jgi:hypothetical protein
MQLQQLVPGMSVAGTAEDMLCPWRHTSYSAVRRAVSQHVCKQLGFFWGTCSLNRLSAHI